MNGCDIVTQYWQVVSDVNNDRNVAQVIPKLASSHIWVKSVKIEENNSDRVHRNHGMVQTIKWFWASAYIRETFVRTLKRICMIYVDSRLS